MQRSSKNAIEIRSLQNRLAFLLRNKINHEVINRIKEEVARKNKDKLSMSENNVKINGKQQINTSNFRTKGIQKEYNIASDNADISINQKDCSTYSENNIRIKVELLSDSDDSFTEEGK